MAEAGSDPVSGGGGGAAGADAGSGPAATGVQVEVPPALDGQRVDRAVALLTGLPRRVVADLVARGAVQVDGRPLTTRSRPLRVGQHLRVEIPAAPPSAPVPDASVAFAVVYEDPELIVVDKPAGLVVHHGAGHLGGTLVDGLLARYPELAELPGAGAGDEQRPGIVHRLDKGTSGLLVVARTPDAFHLLSRQFRLHRAGRTYAALVVGAVEGDAGVIDAPVGRSARQPTRMTVSHQGRPARTSYRVLRRFGRPVPTTLVEAVLDTGRTHQVRVHLAAIGHPVLGDDHDGSSRARPPALAEALAPGRFFLHAARLSVDHPDGRRLSWERALPDDLQQVLDQLQP